MNNKEAILKVLRETLSDESKEAADKVRNVMKECCLLPTSEWTKIVQSKEWHVWREMHEEEVSRIIKAGVSNGEYN